MYFDTSKDECYADFAHLDLKGMEDGAGARVERNDEKINNADIYYK